MDKRKKILMLNSLLLVLCVAIVGLYVLIPINSKKSLESGADAKIEISRLTFDSDGGTAIAALDIEGCAIPEQPTNPTKEGYIFKGWELNGEEYNFDTEVCGDAELKAIWEELAPDKNYITIYYHTDDNAENSPVTVEEGTIPERPVDPTKDGYAFVEWQLNGTTYNFDTPLSDGDVITAVWQQVDSNKEYNVTFNLNGGGGSTPAAQTVKGGSKATNPSEKPTRDKYDFKGWSTSKTAKSANLTSTTISKDTVFYAVWVSNVKTYTVKINLAGGSATNCKSSYTVEDGGTVPSGCSGPKKDGYNFAGWTDGSKSGVMNISGFTNIKKDTTLTASWTVKITNQYKVSFDTDGGSACSPVNIDEGTKISPGTYCDTKKAHYTVSWKPGSATINSNTTFTASWTLNKFVITCPTIKEGNFDSITCQITVTENGKTISGYTLYAGGRVISDRVVNTANVWNNKNFTNITIDYDGLTGIPVTKG